MNDSSISLAYLSVDQLLAGYRERKLSPVDVVQAVLSRIDAYNPMVNAFAYVDHEGALAAARASEERWRAGRPMGALDGVTATIKDTALAKGWRSTFGSVSAQMREPAEFDSPCTARLREAGAVLLGLTTAPEFASRGSTDSLLHGVTRNPWNLAKTPGGSSGGAAVAAALGMGSMHIGTDGGGSIRIPASFTGVFGFKPGFGRVPMAPANPSHGLAYTGPITRSVRDACWMLDAIGRPDPRDWDYLDNDRIDYPSLGVGRLKGVQIAYSPDLGVAAADPQVAAAVERAVEKFSEMGAIVERVDLPAFNPRESFDPIWASLLAERALTVPRSEWDRLDPFLIHLTEAAAKKSALDFVSASRRRAELGCAMRAFHQRFDLLLTPSTSILPFDADDPNVAGSPHWGLSDWAYFSFLFNLTRQPACSIPCGLSDEGLPIGLQIVAGHHQDKRVLEAALAYEQVSPREVLTRPNPKHGQWR